MAETGTSKQKTNNYRLKDRLEKFLVKKRGKEEANFSLIT